MGNWEPDSPQSFILYLYKIWISPTDLLHYLAHFLRKNTVRGENNKADLLRNTYKNKKKYNELFLSWLSFSKWLQFNKVSKDISDWIEFFKSVFKNMNKTL